VSETLDEWGDHRLVEEAALLVSELVTNAVLHARSAVDLVIGRQGGHAVLRVEVHDTSAAPPRLGTFGEDTPSGRGLALVDALSSRWGVETLGSGKRIWFELADTALVER